MGLEGRTVSPSAGDLIASSASLLQSFFCRFTAGGTFSVVELGAAKPMTETQDISPLAFVRASSAESFGPTRAGAKLTSVPLTLPGQSVPLDADLLLDERDLDLDGCDAVG